MFFILSKKNILFTSNSGENLISYALGSSSEKCSLKWQNLLSTLPELPKDPNSQPQPTDNEPAKINVGSFSDNYYVICDTKKNMLVLDRNLEIRKRFVLKRVCTKVSFDSEEKMLYVCDKTGDFYQFKFRQDDDDEEDDVYGKCLLGHCSMLLDFEVTDKFLITCDRDEKIRVTNYPQTYDIHSYCMGHKEFVSTVKLLSSQRMLSTSGDGKIILWNYEKGTKIGEYDFYQDVKNEDEHKIIESKSYRFAIKSLEIDNRHNPQFFVVSFFKRPEFVVFKLDGNQILKVCDFKTDKIPIFVKFDPCHINYLWIVGGIFQDPLQDSGDSERIVKNAEIFELKDGSLQRPFQNDAVLQVLNLDEELRKNIHDESQEERIELLVKHSFNNVQEYHERKKQRIEKEKTTKQI